MKILVTGGAGYIDSHTVAQLCAGDPAVLTASNKKAREVFAWKPEKTMEDIISSAWKWHSKNRTL